MDEQNNKQNTAGEGRKRTSGHMGVSPREEEKARRAAAAQKLKDRKAAEKARKQAEKEEEAARKEAAKAAKKERKAAERKRSGCGTGILVFLLLLVLAFAGTTVGGWYVTNQPTNLDNVYIGGTCVGGLTRDETLKLLQEQGWDESQAEILHVTLPGDVRIKLDYLQAGARHSAEVLADTAYAYGHNSGWYKNLLTFLENKVRSINVNEMDTVINRVYIMDRIEDGVEKFTDLMADTDYHLDLTEGRMRLLKGGGSATLDTEDIYQSILGALASGSTELSYDKINPEISEPDFAAMSRELNVEVQDAYYDEQFNVVPEVSGVILDPALAQQLWDAAEITEYVEIPVELHEPTVTARELEALLYRDMLASTTTSFKWSTENRINNINLAVASINGTILLPGEVFSYNGALGQRTEEAGYKMAGAYSSGQVIQALGGGICQVSSTLYKTTLLAQMETVERTCHQFRVTYLEPGYDATVDWPGVDFKFKNKRDYPVKIVAYCDNDAATVTVEIWGTDVDGSYVELSYGTGTIFDQEWKALGYDVKIGTSAACNVWIYDKDGNKLDNYVEDYSIYSLHEEEIKTPGGMTLAEAKAKKEAEEEEARRAQEEAEAAAAAGTEG